MNPTAMALCGFKCPGQSSTTFRARVRSVAAVMCRMPVSTRRERRLRHCACARRKTSASSVASCGAQDSRKPWRIASYSCCCSSGRTTRVEEESPCLRLFVRLRCLPASVLGPPLLPLRRLAWRCRSDAIWVPFKKMERAPRWRSLLTRFSHRNWGLERDFGVKWLRECGI